MAKYFLKTSQFLIVLIVCLSSTSHAVSKIEYGQVDITIKDNQPCFYIADYQKSVTPDNSDINNLYYAIIAHNSENLFVLNNVSLNIPNSKDSCLSVYDMNKLTNHERLSLNIPYHIEVSLDIKDNQSINMNYLTDFCLVEDNEKLKVVKVGWKTDPHDSRRQINYCTNKEFKEPKSILNAFFNWIEGWFR